MQKLKHFKRVFAILAVLLLFSVCSFAQGIQNPDSSPAIVDQSTDKLNPRRQNLKVLFEKTHKESLTVAQFRSKMSTSTENLAQWEKVLAQFKDDPAADLTYLRELVDVLTLKMEHVNNSPPVENPTSSSNNTMEESKKVSPELDPSSQNAKTLYEKTHKVSLTAVQFEDKVNTSAAKPPIVAQVEVELQGEKKILAFQSANNTSKEELEVFQEKVSMAGMKGLQNFTIDPDTGQCMATVDANIEAADLRHFFAAMGYNQFELIE